MLTNIAGKWWALALRGVIAIIFGVIALLWPSITLLALVLLFGAFAFVDGIFAVTAGLGSRRRNDQWWAVLLAGIAGIIIGLVTLFWPGATALVLLYFIAAWALIVGILQIIGAVHLRRVVEGEWMVIVMGIALVIFGLLLAIFPGAGALGVVWLIGVFAIFIGILQLIFAFRLRGMAGKSI